ncbi:hypothetical protein M569_12011, partial [Genlisea aurea]
FAMPAPFLLLLGLLFTAGVSDISGDRAALLALRSAVAGRTLLWNVTLSDPCNWLGVVCENNRVTVLRLPAASLTGVIPENTISNLGSLRTLSLRLNHLSGALPGDLYKLSELRNLYLQGNQFAGTLPESLFSLHSLVRLDLASNGFSGEIPSDFNNLTHLRTLSLENNQFNGSLPEITLPNLEQFNVSFNNVKGSVPLGLRRNPQNAFLGTSLCGKPLDNSCPNSLQSPAKTPSETPNSGGEHKKKLSGGAIGGIVIGSILLLLLFLLFILCRNRTEKNKAKAGSVDDDLPATKKVQENGKAISEPDAARPIPSQINGFSAAKTDSASKKLAFFGNSQRVFDLEELLRASAEVLGKGTFGTAYKAVLEEGSVVAVKRLKEVNLSDREFKEKIENVGAMDHQNVVPLRAYYFSKEEKLLVYDYMQMGSLSALLHGNRGVGSTPLSWKIRKTIALGAARGIEYLHSQGSNTSHGNIKSSNILLNNSYQPRVSDFGLNHLVGPSTASPARVAGYRAPEVTDPRRVSQQADVYSFGVILLELLTGKAPTQSLANEEGVDLPRWVQSVVREEWTSEVFDIELLRYNTVEDEMVQLLQLGIDCTVRYPDQRPAISEVAKRIEEL